MNGRIERITRESVNLKAIVQRPAGWGARAKVCCAAGEVVAGSGSDLTTDIDTAFQLHLRAAAFILLIGFSIFLIRHVANGMTASARDTNRPSTATSSAGSAKCCRSPRGPIEPLRPPQARAWEPWPGSAPPCPRTANRLREKTSCSASCRPSSSAPWC